MEKRCSKSVEANDKPLYDFLFDDLWTQTPREVWAQYRENGYTDHEAIGEERSQA
jgi:hypothetical protein